MGKREIRWNLGEEIDPYLRITEEVLGQRRLWIRWERDGGMIHISPAAARRFGVALLAYAAEFPEEDNPGTPRGP